MSIHSLRKYKESKILLPDVEKMLQVLSLTEKALSFYTHYMPAAKVSLVIKDQKALLENYQRELLKIKDNKGLRI